MKEHLIALRVNHPILGGDSEITIRTTRDPRAIVRELFSVISSSVTILGPGQSGKPLMMLAETAESESDIPQSATDYDNRSQCRRMAFFRTIR